MKKLLLLLLFVSGIVNAQIVNIPDAKFKAKLISLGFDDSGDGEIQHIEALEVTSLNLYNSTISDLMGIESFTNLTYLNCGHNQLTSLDVASLVNLEKLLCHNNQLTSLDVKPLLNLTELVCGGNQLTSLDVTPLVNLSRLECSDNQLTSLDVTPLVKLTKLECSFNPLPSLDVSNNIALQLLSCANNLTVLDVSNNKALQYLDCSSNLLTTLDVSHNNALTNIRCSFNPNLTYLNLQNGNNKNIIFFDVSKTPLLTCMLVDDPKWSRLNWKNVDVNDVFISNINDCSLPLVYVPDTKFEQALIDTGIDVGLDHYVHSAAIKEVTSLNVSGVNISSLKGIEEFTNLTSLVCQHTYLTSLDVSALSNLTLLACSFNYLKSLNVSGLTNLKTLRCSKNQLTTLDLTGLVNLEEVDCSFNELTTLDLSSSVNLNHLICYFNNLTSIDVKLFKNLVFLWCDSNELKSLDVSKNTALTNLGCANNQLTSLDVTPLVNLTNLGCATNQLTSLNVSKNTALTTLWCGSNELTSLDVSQNNKLTSLICSKNQLTNLDASGNTVLEYLNCSNNVDLETLFIKNNSNESMIIDNIPNLKYICADEFQVASVQNKLNTAGITNTVVNSYCSFNPGGAYNIITGVARFDSDNNGCGENDATFSNLKITIDDGTTTGAMFENSLGVYKTYVQKTNITLIPSFENPNYFTVTPTSVAFNAEEVNGITQSQDFCVTANDVHNDVEVVIVPITTARPGFDTVYKLVYKNKGNQTMSGAVNFTFDDSVLDYMSASVLPNSNAAGTLTWNYANLLPFESRSITVTLNVNSPTETPAVNNGDVLNYSVTISPVSADEMPSDNVFSLNQIVAGSFDPNDITCLEGETVSSTKIGDYLHYNVNFENTGTFAAENIVVKDMIDTAKYDMASLQIMNSSHPVTTRVTDNKVEFIFENINLDANQHGNVVFKIKTKNTLISGDSVANNADIYFDYNAPVTTNTASTAFQALSVGDFEVDNSVSIYPNPTKSNMTINCNNNINRVQLCDVQGRVLVSKTVDNPQLSFDISNYTNGVYFLKITTEKGMKTEKILKD